MQLKDVKRHMAEKTVFRYENGDYIVTACIMRIRDGKWYYQLELKEVGKNCVLIVSMEGIK